MLPADEGAAITLQQLTKVENDAARKAHELKQKAEALRTQRQQATLAAQQQQQQQRPATPTPPAPAAAAPAPAPAPPAPAAAKPAAAAAAAAATAAQARKVAVEEVAAAIRAEQPPQPAAAPAPARDDAEADAEALKQQGVELFQEQRVAEACTQWEQALALARPQGAVWQACHSNLALARVRLGQYEAALGHTDALLKVRRERWMRREGPLGGGVGRHAHGRAAQGA